MSIQMSKYMYIDFWIMLTLDAKDIIDILTYVTE